MTHIACLSFDDYHNIVGDGCKKKYECAGTTHLSKNDFFIVIFHENTETDRNMLSTIIHEIGHALDAQISCETAPHGRSFRKVTKRLLKIVMQNKDKLPTQYQSYDLLEKEVVNVTKRSYIYSNY